MKKIMAAASFDKQKYYLDDEFSSLPQGIKDEVQTICVYLAEKLMCTFAVGFYLESLRSMETISNDVFSFFRQVLDLIPLTQTLVYHIFFFFCLSVFATVFSNVQETPLPQLESLYSFLSQRVSISELSSIVLLFFYCLLTHRSCSCKLIPTSTPSPISPV